VLLETMPCAVGDFPPLFHPLAKRLRRLGHLGRLGRGPQWIEARCK
jgi:hypothetical protein